jgi:hypothetical protein
MNEWAMQTKIQIRNQQPVQMGMHFMLCNYHWILDTHNKKQLTEVYNKLEWKRAQDLSMLRSFWDPKLFKKSMHFEFEVKRTNILQEYVEKFINLKPDKDGFDPIKLPLRIIFEKEAGIDMGGVSKEFFKLIM